VAVASFLVYHGRGKKHRGEPIGMPPPIVVDLPRDALNEEDEVVSAAVVEVNNHDDDVNTNTSEAGSGDKFAVVPAESPIRCMAITSFL
jgi:hypothetical protein